MPYGDTSVLTTTASWPAPVVPRRALGVLPLALATVLSFAAGVGSTLVYLQWQPTEFLVAEAPLIEADRAPTRVRPEGLAGGASPVATASGALPSPISSAVAMPAPVPVIELAPQGIPAAPEIRPPAAAEVVELGPPAAPAPGAVAAVEPRPVGTVEPPPPPVAASVPAQPPPSPEAPMVAAAAPGPETRLQVASLRTYAKAVEEMQRYQRVHAAVVGDLGFEVQRLDQGERGVFYRVLSSPVGDRDDGQALCASLAERRGQCQVMTFAPRAAEPAVAVATATPPAAAAPAPAVAAEPPRGEVRAQLASLRSFEGATRELNRLARLYGGVLEQTELSVSRIDQGERGVFYRILTAPLPSRDAAGALCQSLGDYPAGCVLIPS